MDLNSSKVINLNDPNLNETEKLLDKENNSKSYSRMKVDDLRVLVVTKNITNNDSAQKLKKN